MSRTLLVRAPERALVWPGQPWPRVPNVGLPPALVVPDAPVTASQRFSAPNLSGMTLEAGRVVTIDHTTGGMLYADCATAAHGESVLGVLIASTLPGYTGEAIQSGQIEIATWNWPSGVDALLLGSAGHLVAYADLPVVAVFVRQVAAVLSAIRIVVDDEPAIYR